METSMVPLIAGILVFLASIISLRLGLSVAIIELLLGVIAGNYFGFQAEPWMTYLAGFGGVVLTFLAGAEVDLPLLRSKFKESILIGGASFLVPFLGAFAYTYFLSGWTLNASLIAGARTGAAPRGRAAAATARHGCTARSRHRRAAPGLRLGRKSRSLLNPPGAVPQTLRPRRPGRTRFPPPVRNVGNGPDRKRSRSPHSARCFHQA